jgi:predicted XRE-type DNA-binding protein
MKKIQVTESCGNIFEDIGLANPQDMLIKAQIVTKIEQEIRRRALTQTQAAKIIDIPQSRLSKILRGQFINVSESKLLHCLNKLGFDIQIKVAKKRKIGTGLTSINFAR